MDQFDDKNMQSNGTLCDDISINGSASEGIDIPREMQFAELAVKRISETLKEIVKLNQDALTVYRPIVQDIIDTNCRDVSHIERTLDGVLGFCCDDLMLTLFKDLLRHYYTINPTATASYVHTYKDMWDNSNE